MPISDPSSMFDITGIIEKIPFVGKMLAKSSGGENAIIFWMNKLTNMSQVDWMGMFAVIFGVVSILAYSELLIRAVWPMRRGRMGK